MKIIYKRKKRANDFFIAVLLYLYDPKYLNLTKSRLSDQKSGIVPEVTLILNSKMYIITKFILRKFTELYIILSECWTNLTSSKTSLLLLLWITFILVSIIILKKLC